MYAAETIPPPPQLPNTAASAMMSGAIPVEEIDGRSEGMTDVVGLRVFEPAIVPGVSNTNNAAAYVGGIERETLRYLLTAAFEWRVRELVSIYRQRCRHAATTRLAGNTTGSGTVEPLAVSPLNQLWRIMTDEQKFEFGRDCKAAFPDTAISAQSAATSATSTTATTTVAADGVSVGVNGISPTDVPNAAKPLIDEKAESSVSVIAVNAPLKSDYDRAIVDRWWHDITAVQSSSSTSQMNDDTSPHAAQAWLISFLDRYAGLLDLERCFNVAIRYQLISVLAQFQRLTDQLSGSATLLATSIENCIRTGSYSEALSTLSRSVLCLSHTCE